MELNMSKRKADSTYTDIVSDLKINGFTILRGALTKKELFVGRMHFDTWWRNNPQVQQRHNDWHPHGIFKFGLVTHSKWNWYTRTRPGVLNAFTAIWGTDSLLASFCGGCYMPPDLKKRDSSWAHWDQDPKHGDGFRCVQGYVSYTENTQRTIGVVRGSHLKFASYVKERGLKAKGSWLRPDKAESARFTNEMTWLHVRPGDLVLWDSRTIHQNRYGAQGEERLVAYVSMMSKVHAQYDWKQMSKRFKAWKERRQTSHWCYPLKLCGKQPQVYGKKEKLIKHDELYVEDVETYYKYFVKYIA